MQPCRRNSAKLPALHPLPPHTCSAPLVHSGFLSAYTANGFNERLLSRFAGRPSVLGHACVPCTSFVEHHTSSPGFVNCRLPPGQHPMYHQLLPPRPRPLTHPCLRLESILFRCTSERVESGNERPVNVYVTGCASALTLPSVWLAVTCKWLGWTILVALLVLLSGMPTSAGLPFPTVRPSQPFPGWRPGLAVRL